MQIYNNKTIRQYSILGMALSVGIFSICLGTKWDETQAVVASFTPKVETNVVTKEVKSVLVPSSSYSVSVTCFSSVECKSAFCQRNAGKPRGLRVAVDQSNPYFGQHKFSKVYIPAYDKTYEIVPETATGTDLDIWMGDDYDSAKRCGYPTLTVNFIK